MTADKRNATVVIALILSMTIGARVLLWLEPSTPRWSGDPLLTAERGAPVQEVEVAYAAASTDPYALVEKIVAAGDSACVIDPAGEPLWKLAGPQVRLVVVGSESDKLGDQQKRTLLAALNTFSQASGVDLVPVRLAAGSDKLQNPRLPLQAGDLRALLERKGIID